MTTRHAHQHSSKVVGTGTTVDQALSHALSGLRDPQGHHSHIAFQSFEIVRIGGSFDRDGATVQVTLEAFGSHK